jgi:hypothetical protein
MSLRPAYILVIAATTIGVSMGLATTPLLAQSQPTLRQMAIEHGGIGRVTIGCGPSPSLVSIVKAADLIVEGVVSKRVSYLTADDDHVDTDYELSLSEVLFQRQILTTTRPGIVAPMVFKSRGGRVVIDGLEIVDDVRGNSARVDIKEGDHVFAFAKRDAKDGKWILWPYDVFRVVGANVVAPDTFSDVAKSVPREQFLRKIHQLQTAARGPF